MREWWPKGHEAAREGLSVADLAEMANDFGIRGRDLEHQCEYGRGGYS